MGLKNLIDFKALNLERLLNFEDISLERMMTAEFWTDLEVWVKILTGAMLLTSGFFVFSFVSYLRKYKILTVLFTSLNKRSQAYNLARREQLQKKLETKVDTEKPKMSIVENLYYLIRQLDILDKLPGFGEIHVLALYTVTVLGLSIIVARKTIFYGGIAFFALFILATGVLSAVAISRKRTKIEEQLSLFINACEGAASIHPDIIDIIGDVFPRTRAPLNKYLEECYLEAKITNDKTLALNHLKEKTNSPQFRSVIDNLLICSKETGDYQKVIDDIREPMRIAQSFKKKRIAITRNARTSILLMTGAGAVIVFISTFFLDDATEALLKNPLGITLLSVAVLIMLFGLTIRAD